ncbi:ribonuclease H [Senna tora]|uniref:Ribonuclease H n=1 Tax=Senna tora TaxID=362788 RepID=A0A835CHV4_9FABA|nr:ribonuclease H [Senna tora]
MKFCRVCGRACGRFPSCLGLKSYYGVRAWKVEYETRYHVLIECEKIKHIWDNAPFDFKGRASHSLILEWMVVECDKWGRDQRCSFAIALYYIWEAKNESMAKSVQEHPTTLKWVKPREPFIKLNVDVALKDNGEGSAGGVFRDHEGLCVGAFSSKIPAMRDIALMEAMGMKKDIDVVQEGGITHLIVETDAKLVVDMLHSTCTHVSKLSATYRSILEVCMQFRDCEIRWILRTCNGSADCMAKVALSFSCNMTWPNSVPI